MDYSVDNAAIQRSTLGLMFSRYYVLRVVIVCKRDGFESSRGMKLSKYDNIEGRNFKRISIMQEKGKGGNSLKLPSIL
jgi:hypothetical protein